MDAKQVWLAALERLRRRVSPAAFAAWFGATTGMELAGTQLTVAVPTSFVQEYLQGRFAESARVVVSEVLGERATVVFAVRDTPAPATAAPARKLAAQPRARATSHRVAVADPPRSARPTTGRRGTRVSRTDVQQPALVAAQTNPVPPTPRLPVMAAPVTVPLNRGRDPYPTSGHADLHPRYHFDSFIVGTANRLAYAAAQEVASNPGLRYNPLLIYGGVGLGKTHLLHAIGHFAHQRGLSVVYVTAERFTNEIIDAIRQRTTNEFRARYRAVDMLLVDDVQFIAGKDSTEEEFFHTFNTLHESDRQIVLTSDRVPLAMHHLHDRLRSRFQWGLLADIQSPDFEHRLEILRAKAVAVRAAVPEDVLVSLARPECASIRELEGALNRVIAQAHMLNQPLDARLVSRLYAQLEDGAHDRSLDAEEVIAAVARHYHLSIRELAGKTREHAVAWARQVAMYLLREETPASLLQIGQHLGGRDHTTVRHGYDRVGKALAQDERVRSDIAAIRGMLRPA